MIKNDEYYNFTKKENQRHWSVGVGTTRIGSEIEKRNSGNPKWYLLDKMNAFLPNEETNFNNAIHEIKRLCVSLHLPDAFISYVFKQYKTIWNLLPAGTKFRGYQKLVPCVIYICAKLKCIVINKKILIEHSDVSKGELNYFLLHAKVLIPWYDYRDRKKYIYQKIMMIIHNSSLEMKFFHESARIVEKLMPLFHVKDELYAGIACCITLLAFYYPDAPITLNETCTKIGIMESTVEARLNKLLDREGGIVTKREEVLEKLREKNIIE